MPVGRIDWDRKICWLRGETKAYCLTLGCNQHHTIVGEYSVLLQVYSMIMNTALSAGEVLLLPQCRVVVVTCSALRVLIGC